MDEFQQMLSGRSEPVQAPPASERLTGMRSREGGSYGMQQHSDKSSASGAYGITAPAYTDIQKNDPYFAGKAQNQLTPQEQDRAANVYHSNVLTPRLTQLGIQPTEQNLQLSHFLGADGAANFLKTGQISPEAAAANGGVAKATKIAQERMSFGAGLDQKQQQTEPTFENMLRGSAAVSAAPMQQQQPAPAEQPAPTSQPTQESSVGQQILKAFTPSKEAAVSNLQNLASMPGAIAGSVAQLAGLAGGGNAEARTQAASAIADKFTPDVAKMLGVDPNHPDYKSAALARIAEVPEYMINQVAEMTGIPAADLNAVATLAPIAGGLKGSMGRMKEQFGAKGGTPVEGRVEPGMGTTPKQYREGASVTPENLVEQPSVITTANPVEQQMQQQFAQQKMQQIKPEAAANEPVAGINTQPTSVATGGRSMGAAETNLKTQVVAALENASPQLKAQIANKPLESWTPQELTALENHNKFAKFDMTPTEGQALQDSTKMSDEYNQRTRDPQLQARFEERDPKLIEGFNKIKEKTDINETNPVQLANAPLEKMAAIDKQKLAEIDNAYKTLFDAGGRESPIDAKALAKDVIDNLHKNYLYEEAPASIKNALEKHLNGEPMTFEQFDALTKRSAAMMRSGGDSAQVGYQLRHALEKLPLTGDAIGLKALRDQASSLVRQRYALLDKVPAYKTAALGDIRTAEQINAGVPHPAADTFMAKHFGAKTPQVDISNMLDIIGRDSMEHNALKAAKIEQIKNLSGIVGEKGKVSQAALNKALEAHKSNADVIFGREIYNDLQDLRDVAHLTEPVKGVHHVNVSNTAVVNAQNSVAKFLKGSLKTGAEVAINLKTGIGGTLLRNALEGHTKGKAAQAELQSLINESQRRLNPAAGILLKDIGKK